MGAIWDYALFRGNGKFLGEKLCVVFSDKYIWVTGRACEEVGAGLECRRESLNGRKRVGQRPNNGVFSCGIPEFLRML